MSSMLSAPTTIPATRALTFAPAWEPLSVGNLRCASANIARRHFWAKVATGTSPAHDTRLDSSKRRSYGPDCEIVASTRCPSLWPNKILEKSHSSTTTGHFAFTTHLRPLPHRWIKA